MISESILNGSLCLLVVWYCDFCSLACIALSDRKVKCFFFSLSLAFWLSSYEWNKCLYNLAFLLFCWYMPSPYFIFPCSGIFWSWLRLLKLKMLRQRHIYPKLRFAIWLFLPLHTLTLISCNIIIWSLLCRLLVKHMKICRHRTKICWTRWSRGMTIILRYVLLLSLLNTALLLSSPSFRALQ